jgi:hypothetical protein
VTPVPALLVPPVRFGRLLRDARLANDDSTLDLMRRSGLAFDEDWFAAVELGHVELDEPLVRWLTELYGVPAGALVPARSELIIDLTEGFVAVGDARRVVASNEPERILTDYLALVYLLRGLPVGSPIEWRNLDMTVLGDALRRRPTEVRARLDRMVATDREPVGLRASVLRRRLVVPLAGVLVGLTAVGGLLLVRSGTADADDRPAGAQVNGTPSVEIGTAVVLEAGSVQHAR